MLVFQYCRGFSWKSCCSQSHPRNPSQLANWQCGPVVESFILFLRQPLMDTVCKWTNAEGELVYNKEWKTVKTEDLKRFIGVTILVGDYKSKSENIIQLWSKHDGRSIFNHKMSRRRYQQIL